MLRRDTPRVCPRSCLLGPGRWILTLMTRSLGKPELTGGRVTWLASVCSPEVLAEWGPCAHVADTLSLFPTTGRPHATQPWVTYQRLPRRLVEDGALVICGVFCLLVCFLCPPLSGKRMSGRA